MEVLLSALMTFVEMFTVKVGQPDFPCLGGFHLPSARFRARFIRSNDSLDSLVPFMNGLSGARITT